MTFLLTFLLIIFVIVFFIKLITNALCWNNRIETLQQRIDDYRLNRSLMKMYDFVALFYAFFICAMLFVLLRICLSCTCAKRQTSSLPQRRVIQTIRIDPAPNNNEISDNQEDRQGNVFTIANEGALNNNGPSYTEFVILGSSSEEIRRIRAQQEKDDKDLPSYDEVMSLSSPVTPRVESHNATASSSRAVVLDPMGLPPAPPYSEIDPVATGNSSSIVLAHLNERTAGTAPPIQNGS